MTTHQKGTTLTLTGAVLLALTVVIRHTSTDPTAQRLADDIIPAIAFLLLLFGIRYTIRSRKEAAPPSP